MKRIGFAFLIAVIMISLFAVPTFAYSVEDGAEEYWDDFLSAAPEGSIDEGGVDELLSQIGADDIFCQLWFALSEVGGGVAAFFLMLVGLSVLLASSELFLDSDNKLAPHVGAACSLVGGLLIFSHISPLVRSVSDSISTLNGFFAALVPIFSGILAASGNVNSAGAGAVNMNIALASVSFIADNLLLPLTFCLFSLSLLSGLSDGRIASLAKSIKGLFGWGLGIAATVIVASSSLQSVVSNAADSAYLRAAKHAVTGMIPMVGGTVSAALSTLAGGLTYVKSAIGAGSVMVVITLALSPLLTLLLYRLAISSCLSFLEFMDAKGGVRLFAAFRAALDSLIAVYTVSVVVYIAEVIIFVKSGVDVFG